MDDWLDDFARALGERPLEREEAGAVLGLARDVAHGVERRLAPLASFVAGMHVQRRVAEGTAVPDAVREIRAAARALIPKPPSA
jgi:uncharacterized protein DUF6457